MTSGKRMDYMLFAMLAAFWGGSFVAIKYVVDVFPPVFGATLRVAVALLVLTAIFKAEGRGLAVSATARRKMWLAGLFAQGLPFCLLFWGERRISPGLAGVINGTVPIWTFLLGLAAGTGETLTGKKIFGLALGLLGISVIFGPLIVFGGTRAEILGAAAVFGMALSYGVGSLLSRSLLSGSQKADFRSNLFHQHCGSVAFLILVTTCLEPWPSSHQMLAAPTALISVVYLGVVSTAAAFLIYYHLIREWGAVRASAVTYVAPVFALFWDFVFFRNLPTASVLIGAAAILSGVLFLNAPAQRT